MMDILDDVTATSVGILGPRNSGKTVTAIAVLHAKAAVTKFHAIIVFCQGFDTRDAFRSAFPHANIVMDVSEKNVTKILDKYESMPITIAVVIEEMWAHKKAFRKLRPCVRTFVVEIAQYDVDLAIRHSIVLLFAKKAKNVKMACRFTSTSEEEIQGMLDRLNEHEAIGWQRRWNKWCVFKAQWRAFTWMIA